MKTINELITKPLNNKSETHSTGPQLTTGDKDLVNWFFLRLETSYGHKFHNQFSDKESVIFAKKEWTKEILCRSKEMLHIGLERAKKERQKGNAEYDWPDIAKILGLCTKSNSPDGKNSAAYLMIDDPRHPKNDPNSPEYCPKPRGIESDTWKSKRRLAGESELSKLKSMFN